MIRNNSYYNIIMLSICLVILYFIGPCVAKTKSPTTSQPTTSQPTTSEPTTNESTTSEPNRQQVNRQQIDLLLEQFANIWLFLKRVCYSRTSTIIANKYVISEQVSFFRTSHLFADGSKVANKSGENIFLVFMLFWILEPVYKFLNYR